MPPIPAAVLNVAPRIRSAKASSLSEPKVQAPEVGMVIVAVASTTYWSMEPGLPGISLLPPKCPAEPPLSLS